MVLSLMKRQGISLNKNRRKIIAVGLCCSVLFCMFFRQVNNGLQKSSIVVTQLLRDGSQRIFYNTSDSLTTCSWRRQYNIDCLKLTIGDDKEFHRVNKEIKNNKIEYKCQLSNLAENCEVLKVAHNYITDEKMILPEEFQFPLAFAIKLHRSPEQAEQLLRTIYRPHNVYCIYVDKKAKMHVYELMKKIGNCFENIFVVENRINIVYSSINLVEAELECMRILSKTNTTWKYYINLTGQEFPLKTNFEIVKILQKLYGGNDIESYFFPLGYQQRYTLQHVIKDNVIIKTKAIKSSFIRKFQMSKGSAYGTFSRPFVEFILTDLVARKFLKWLNGSYAPEESAWATLNSLPWAPGGFPRETRHSSHSFLSRAIIWSWDGIKCHGHFVRGICVYGSLDLPWLVSRSELFANKFDLDWDPLALDCLEDVLRDRTRDNKIEILNWHYYNTLPHVEYFSRIRHIHKSKEYLQAKRDKWLREHNITLKQIENLSI